MSAGESSLRDDNCNPAHSMFARKFGLARARQIVTTFDAE